MKRKIHGRRKYVQKLAYLTPSQAVALDEIAQDIAEETHDDANVCAVIRRFVDEGIKRYKEKHGGGKCD